MARWSVPTFCALRCRFLVSDLQQSQQQARGGVGWGGGRTPDASFKDRQRIGGGGSPFYVCIQ